MGISKLCLFIVGILACTGVWLSALVQQTHAQWKGTPRMLHRGAIAHSLLNKGMSGRRDNGKKQARSGFSYPQGRSLLVYSGGSERDGWNNKVHSAGEGIWVMSRTGGEAKISYSGTDMEPPDIVSLPHDVSTYPEAYLGAAHDPDWALAVRDGSGGRAAWTDAMNLMDVVTNSWPARGPVEGQNPPAGHPAVIWNYHWNADKSGVPFAQRVAAGEFGAPNSPAWAAALSEDDFPDVIGIQKAKSSDLDLQWTRKWYQWGHTDCDDFLIVDHVVENVGGTVAGGVYLVIKNRFLSGAENTWFQGSDVWHGLSGKRLPADDYVRSTLAPNYLEGGQPLGREKPAGSARGADLARQGHAMVYLHDGDQVAPEWSHNDWGGPYLKVLGRTVFSTDQQWIEEGFFNHPTYWGLGVIDAFPPFNTYGGLDPDAYVAPYDNPETERIDESVQQPASITMWQFTNHLQFEQPDPVKDTDAEVYRMLTQEWGTNTGYMAEPDEIETFTEFVSFGPYTLQPGEKFKVVVAYVGGMASQSATYADYRKYARPFEFAWMNMYNGPGTKPADWRVRQQELPLGEEAMFDNFERAIQAYNRGYDIPNQPPNIRLSMKNDLDGNNVILWSACADNAVDPDYDGEEARDIRGYRVYRSRTENQGPFELAAEFSIADARAGRLPHGIAYDPDGVFLAVRGSAFEEAIPQRENPLVSGTHPDAGAEVKGLYTFTDSRVMAGYPNWYFVRAYDSGHGNWKGAGLAVPPLESAPGPGGAAQLGGTRGIVPLVPTAAAFNQFEKKVGVVPNPFRIDDLAHSYRGQQNIRFINLPGRCQVDIYDVAGQRVWTQFNDDPNKGEITWRQHTEGRPSDIGQAVFPGVYFYRITSLMPESMWKTQTGTFLVIK